MTGDTENADYIEWMETNHDSSLTRYKTAEKLLNKSLTVDEMLNSISDRSNKDCRGI